MQKIYDRDGSATVKSRDLRLSGDTLARYIKEYDIRIDVTRFLKWCHEGRLVQMTPHLTRRGGPVSGGDTIARSTAFSQGAEVTDAKLDLEIKAS